VRILIVEDDEFSNLALMHLLESEHEVFATREAESADLVLRNQQFDLILLDIGLPGMDGIALSEHVRHQTINRETPIVAVSGLEGEEVVQRAQTSGFNAFIKKPYTVEALREVLDLYGGTPTPPGSLQFRIFQ
jgi:two-component system, sensor histidine kinase